MISFRDGWKTTKTKWWNLSGYLQGPHLSTMHWAGSPDPTEFTIVAHRPPGNGKNIQKTSIHIQWFHIQLQDISVFLPGKKIWGIPNHHSGEWCWLHKVIYPILLDIYPWFLHHLRPRYVGRMFDASQNLWLSNENMFHYIPYIDARDTYNVPYRTIPYPSLPYRTLPYINLALH